MIDINIDVIYFKDGDDFYKWLEDHHDKTNELWVLYYKKSTGRASLTWSASVDSALCFGWIDGIRKTVDEERYKIRFTPRKVKSVWSAVNVKKVNDLIKLGKMRPEGLDLFNKRTDLIGYATKDRDMTLKKEYEIILEANQKAWIFFNALAPSYKKNSIWWVMSAKKEETRLKRLDVLIMSSEQGLKIPMLRKK